MTFTPASTDCSRRQLLRGGLRASALLATAGSAAWVSGCAQRALQAPINRGEHHIYTFLQHDDLIMLSALAPVIIGQHWPMQTGAAQTARDQILARTDTFIARMGDHNMHELRQLFDLLNQRMTRGLTTGLWAPWPEQSAADIAAFLESWKHSRFALFNSAYNALTDIIGFAWYSMPTNTATFGYAGPPAALRAALPQFQEPAS